MFDENIFVDPDKVIAQCSKCKTTWATLNVPWKCPFCGKEGTVERTYVWPK